MAAEGNFALAFGLVIAAGACTCLGALLVFCSNLANPKWLSGSLGASAGVMIYISFVEILSTKAVQGFRDSGFSEAQAQRYACFSFFAGLMATWLLGKALELITRGAAAWQARKAAKSHQDATAASLPTTNTSTSPADADIEIPDVASGCDRSAAAGSKDVARAVAAAAAPAASPPAVAAGCNSASPDVAESCSVTLPVAPPSSSSGCGCCCSCAGARLCEGGGCSSGGGVSVAQKEAQRDLLQLLTADSHGIELKRMGVLTGLAVGLHNLPEGVATFAAALASPATGVVIAIAIALHNIPEGVAVALPLYYATGSKWKGLMWATISGAAEPLGGLIGYAVLSSTGMSQLAFGVMFSLVAGMMVYISIRELLPTALRYDPKDSCATACAFWGMAVMAASLLLFKAKE